MMPRKICSARNLLNWQHDFIVWKVLCLSRQAAKDGVGIRLAITQANGTEHEQVIHVAAGEEQRLHVLQGQFEALLTKDRRLGLAAASRALWSSLGKEAKEIK